MKPVPSGRRQEAGPKLTDCQVSQKLQSLQEKQEPQEVKQISTLTSWTKRAQPGSNTKSIAATVEKKSIRRISSKDTNTNIYSAESDLL